MIQQISYSNELSLVGKQRLRERKERRNYELNLKLISMQMISLKMYIQKGKFSAYSYRISRLLNIKKASFLILGDQISKMFIFMGYIIDSWQNGKDIFEDCNKHFLSWYR